jgi:hypothetical protein
MLSTPNKIYHQHKNVNTQAPVYTDSTIHAFAHHHREKEVSPSRVQIEVILLKYLMPQTKTGPMPD